MICIRSRDDSASSIARPRLPTELQILPDVFDRIRRNQNRHARNLLTVDLDREVVIAVEDVVELITSAVTDALACKDLIASVVENHVERDIRVLVRTSLRSIDLKIAEEREAAARAGARLRSRRRLRKYSRLNCQYESNNQPGAFHA